MTSHFRFHRCNHKLHEQFDLLLVVVVAPLELVVVVLLAIVVPLELVVVLLAIVVPLELAAVLVVVVLPAIVALLVLVLVLELGEPRGVAEPLWVVVEPLWVVQLVVELCVWVLHEFELVEEFRIGRIIVKWLFGVTIRSNGPECYCESEDMRNKFFPVLPGLAGGGAALTGAGAGAGVGFKATAGAGFA